MANLPGINLPSPVVPFADDGYVTGLSLYTDGDKRRLALADLFTLKVRPDGKLNLDGLGSGQLSLGMIVPILNTGTRYELKCDMTWWNTPGRTESAKVSALQTTLTAYDPAQPGKCWWEAVTGGIPLTGTTEGAPVTGGIEFYDAGNDNYPRLLAEDGFNTFIYSPEGAVAARTTLQTTGFILQFGVTEWAFSPTALTLNGSPYGGGGGGGLSADIVAGLQNANAISALNPVLTLDDQIAPEYRVPAGGSAGNVLTVQPDGTTRGWSTPSGGGGGSSTLAGLTDVSLASIANQQVLRYNSTSGKWENATLAAGGDMAKSTYDTNNSGAVDNSEKLGGQDSAYHLDRTNHTGTQAISSVTGLQTALNAKQPYDVHSVLTYASSLTIDFATDNIRTISLAGNLTLTTSNRAVTRQKVVRLIADGTARTLTFPAGWVWLGSSAPTSLAASKTAVLSLYCFGAAETDIVATYAAQL